MNGAEIRLGQLFDRESGRSFIAAFDHGLTLGPKSGSEDVIGNLRRIIDGNPDGILISPGVMKIAGELFAFRGAPVPIVRADWIYNGEVFPGLPAALQDHVPRYPGSLRSAAGSPAAIPVPCRTE